MTAQARSGSASKLTTAAKKPTKPAGSFGTSVRDKPSDLQIKKNKLSWTAPAQLKPPKPEVHKPSIKE